MEWVPFKEHGTHPQLARGDRPPRIDRHFARASLRRGRASSTYGFATLRDAHLRACRVTRTCGVDDGRDGHPLARYGADGDGQPDGLRIRADRRYRLAEYGDVGVASARATLQSKSRGARLRQPRTSAGAAIAAARCRPLRANANTPPPDEPLLLPNTRRTNR